jgi:hypothetical protein
MTGDGATAVMTGPWLFVKWIGIAISLVYVVLAVEWILRFRWKSPRQRFGALWPMTAGTFVGLVVPWIFEKVLVTRICFVVASAVFLYGAAIVVRAIARQHKGLPRADG